MSGTYTLRSASLGGDDTLNRPSVLTDYLADDINGGLADAGTQFYFKTGHRFQVFRWDGTDMGFPSIGGGAYSPSSWAGSTLLFALESFPYYRVLRWTEQDGVRALVGFGNDYTKGAGQPGSDGVDLVWTQGENMGYDDYSFPDRRIMTSKFSTEPAK